MAERVTAHSSVNLRGFKAPERIRLLPPVQPRYLLHVAKSGEILAAVLLTWHKLILIRT
jgi:hypothetical protein